VEVYVQAGPHYGFGVERSEFSGAALPEFAGFVDELVFAGLALFAGEF
jgi:hypothetical protein